MQFTAWVTAFVAAGLLTWLVSPILLAGHQKYPDFIAGLLAFDDYFKSGELRVIIAFPIIFALLLPVVWFALSKFWKHPSIENSFVTALTTGEIFLVFAGLIAARYFLYLKIGDSATTLAGIALLLCALRGWKPALDLLPAVGFGMLWGYFFVISIFALWSTFDPVTMPPTDDIVVWSKYSAIGSAIIATVLRFVRPAKFAAFLLALQLPLPLLLIRYFRLHFFHPAGNVVFQMSPVGAAVLILIATAMLYSTIKQLAKSIRESSFASCSVSTGSAVAIAFFLSFGLPPASPFQADDFHLAEMLLPWQQIVQLGQSNFHDFVSIQGYLALTIGLINKVFFDGGISSYYSASIFTGASFAGLSAFLAARLLTPYWALALTPFLLPSSNRFFLVPAAILLLCNPKLLASPSRWCPIAIVVAWFCVLWNAASGVALAVALFPLGLFQLYSLKNKQKEERDFGFLFSTLAIVGILLFTPVLGTIQFILENGSTSVVAHGNPLLVGLEISPGIASFFKSPFLNRMVFEGIRVGGWMLVFMLFVLAFVLTLRKKVTSATLGLLSITGGYCLLTLVLFPQSMGRVDAPPYLSRTGAHALLALGFFLPLGYAYAREKASIRFVPVLGLGFLAGIPLAFRDDSPASLAALATHQINVPAQFELYQGDDARLPGLSRIYMPPAKLAQILQFREALDHFRRKDETFADLANRGIYHLLFGLEYPSPYPFVHAVNEPIQRRLIERFNSEKPAVVWLSPSFEIDRGPPALRSYRVWRWLIANGYRYADFGGYGFMLRADRFNELYPNAAPDEIPAGLIADTHRPQLDGLPRAWGRSYDSLKSLVKETPLKFSVIETSGMLDGKDGWNYPRFANASISLQLEKNILGVDADYLLLDMEAQGNANARTSITLNWTDGDQPYLGTKVFKFRCLPGRMIIPIANDPRWLLRSINKLRLSFMTSRKGLSWKIAKVSALKLRTKE